MNEIFVNLHDWNNLAKINSSTEDFTMVLLNRILFTWYFPTTTNLEYVMFIYVMATERVIGKI